MKKVASDIPLVTLLGHGPQVGIVEVSDDHPCKTIHTIYNPPSQNTQESLTSAIDRRSDYYRQAAREKQSAKQPKSLLNLPNVLTLLRIAFTPVLIGLWFAPWRLAPICCAVLFILQSITDWLDGYLARRVCVGVVCRGLSRVYTCTIHTTQLKLTSAFGAFLDPVADKLMYEFVGGECVRTLKPTHTPRLTGYVPHSRSLRVPPLPQSHMH